MLEPSEIRKVHRLSRVAVLVAAGAMLLTPLLGVSTAGAAPQATARRAAAPFDLNGDGFAELVAGMPSRTVHGQEWAGAVSILYGSARGLRATHSQYLTQDSRGIKGVANSDKQFGLLVTSADFDSDGRADLAISAAHRVLVVYGGKRGLTTRDQLIDTDRYGLNFLDRLGTGDFDRDGYPDLVVTSEGEEEEPGGLVVFRGSKRGLVVDQGLAINLDTASVPGESGGHDRFGRVIAAGDLTGDGYDDLVVAGYDDGNAGIVYLFRGSSGGLTTKGIATFSTEAEAMAVADFNDDGFADLVVGDSPEVHVFAGSRTGLETQAGQVFRRDDWPDVPATPDSIDSFGDTHAVGDLNGDHHPDLAIGVPYEALGDVLDAGAVAVLYGSSRGLTKTGAQLWSQATPRIKGFPRAEDRFGLGPIRILNFGKGRQADLAVHSPYDGPNDRPSGAVNVLYSSRHGVTTSDQYWHPNRRGLAGRTAARDTGYGGNCC